jgi:hypothetical protein
MGAGTSTQTGLIADQIQQNAYLENVYIEVTQLANHVLSAPITRYVAKNAGLSMKNVVVYAHGEKIGATSRAVMGFASKPITIKTENLVYIHPIEGVTAMHGRTGTGYLNGEGLDYFFKTGTTGFAGANAKDNFDTAVTNETVELTDFIKGVMYPANN